MALSINSTTPGYGFDGAGGGGSSLYNIAIQNIDLTDGSWTQVDPATQVAALSYDAGLGGNLVEWNGIAASSDNTWASGSGCVMPRWHKPLEIDGNRITTADFLTCLAQIVPDLAVDDFNQQVVVGVCVAPGSTVLSTLSGTGAIFSRIVASNANFGTWQVNAASGSQFLGPQRGIAWQTGGGNARGGGYYITTDGSNVPIAASPRNSNLIGVTPADLSIVVGIGARDPTTTIAPGDQQRFAAAFGVVTWALP